MHGYIINNIAIVNLCIRTNVAVPSETKLASMNVETLDYYRFPLSNCDSHIELGWRDKNSLYMGYETLNTFGYKSSTVVFCIK